MDTDAMSKHGNEFKIGRDLRFQKALHQGDLV
jgi:hypothetical protein